MTAATLFGPCGYYNGSAVMRLANVSFLSGLTAMTVQFYAKPAAVMVGSSHGFFTVNTPDGTDATSSLCVQYLASSSAGTNVIHVKLKTSSGAAVAFSSQNIHSTNPQLVHVVFQDGSAPKIYVDGVNVTSATGAVAQSGGLSLGSGGLYVGAGPRDTASGGYVGLLDELRVYPAARSAGWIATEAASYLTPSTFYGLGGEDLATDADLACVPVPVTVGAVIGTAQDIDVVAAAYDPEGGAKTIVGTPTITAGTVSIVANKLRATPSALPATASYAIQDSSAKQSTGYARLRTAPPVSAAYNWRLSFPGAADLDTAKVREWRNGDGAPSSYAVGDILVMLKETSAISNLSIGFDLKGPMVVCGQTFNPRDNGLYANYSSLVKGRGAMASVDFASAARSPVTWEGRNWPFYWFVNNYIDWSANDCCFGDLMKVTQRGRSANDASHAFTGPKAAVFWQKNYVAKGPHYVNTTAVPPSEDSRDGHSDGIQDMGGIPIVRAADCHLAFPGGQIFFLGKEAEVCGFPRSTRWEFYNVVLDHIAKWNANVQAATSGTGLTRIPKFIQGSEDAAGALETSDYATGKYLASYFGAQCYIRTLLASPSLAEKKAYLGPGNGVGFDANNNFTFDTAIKGDHTYPMFAGQLKLLAAGSDLPQAVDPAQTGKDVGFANKSEFLAAIGRS